MGQTDDGSRNRHLQLKITNAGEEWINTTGAALGLTKADTVREALAFTSARPGDFRRFVAKRTNQSEENHD